MGFCHESHGPNRISVEERRESFVIHAGYGYSLGRSQIGDLRPGDTFIAEGRTWKIYALYEDHAEVKDPQSQDRQQFHLGHEVEVPGTERFDEDVPLAKVWKNNPHPEMHLRDLPDLFRALADLENCPFEIKRVILDLDSRLVPPG